MDAVDDPAANPDGLFRGRRDAIAADAEKLLAFSLGLATERPQFVALDVDPTRAAGFVNRVLSRHNLSIVNAQGEIMPGMTTAELDAGLQKQFASTITPATAAKLSLAKKAPGKITKSEDGEESGEDDEEDMEDDEEEDDTGLSAATAADVALAAKPAGSPITPIDQASGAPTPKKKKDQATTAAPGDQGAVQDDYQETQDEESEAGVASAEDGTPIQSPGKDKKKGKGPLGDASNNVGYSRADAVAECKTFSDAFGAQGATWFAAGKTFAEAQKLHTAALIAENKKLKEDNAALAAKAQKHRGLSAPLNAGGEASSISPEQKQLGINVGGGGIARFAAGLSEQLIKARSGGVQNN